MRSGLSYNLQTDAELPPGNDNDPKLGRFRSFAGEIQFKSLLSSPPSSSVSSASSNSYEEDSGGHGHVFEVDIDGDSFALKIFKFFQIPVARQKLGPIWSERVDDKTLTFQYDPFFAECRAYGRINEHRQEIRDKRDKTSKRNAAQSEKKSSKKRKTSTSGTTSNRKPREEMWTKGEIAVPCHGYLAVSAAKYEDFLSKEYGITDWSRPERDAKLSANKRQPFRALVKTLVRSGLTVLNPQKMLRDLKLLRSLGVFQRDIHAGNYGDGLLLDFSVAWTEPYWMADWLRDKGSPLEARQSKELYQFDEVIAASGIKTKVRATPDPRFAKTRSRKKITSGHESYSELD
ncbi:MAG: hypothetical protein M1820_008597 [Bogoriella megaspora]|nr:MAG: hypothetical protein M1820_008597 [Bogoriella megaspora]